MLPVLPETCTALLSMCLDIASSNYFITVIVISVINYEGQMSYPDISLTK